jgi:TonB family protein
MRPRLLALLAFAIVPLAASAEKAPPFDAKALLTEAAPFYDFDQAGLHPWHLKATYQFFTLDGTPSGSGTFDYWWAGPHVDRSTWTRDGKTLTEWNTADNKQAFSNTGLTLEYDEARIRSVLLDPLPSSDELNSENVQLEARSVGDPDSALRCAMFGPRMPGTREAPMGLFPTYCFDTRLPVLIAQYAYEAPVIEYLSIVKMQNRFLARQINFVNGKRTSLSIAVNGLFNMAANDPALTPAPDAEVFPRVTGKRIGVPSIEQQKKGVPMPPGVTAGKLVSKVFPIYPTGSKASREQGVVVLEAVIGTDGWIHGLQVKSAPFARLAASALAAVSRWRYKPYLLNGKPVEVETTVSVIYSLSP